VSEGRKGAKIIRFQDELLRDDGESTSSFIKRTSDNEWREYYTGDAYLGSAITGCPSWWGRRIGEQGSGITLYTKPLLGTVNQLT
jgi:hypothetical protein